MERMVEHCFTSPSAEVGFWRRLLGSKLMNITAVVMGPVKTKEKQRGWVNVWLLEFLPSFTNLNPGRSHFWSDMFEVAIKCVLRNRGKLRYSCFKSLQTASFCVLVLRCESNLWAKDFCQTNNSLQQSHRPKTLEQAGKGDHALEGLPIRLFCTFIHFLWLLRASPRLK